MKKHLVPFIVILILIFSGLGVYIAFEGSGNAMEEEFLVETYIEESTQEKIEIIEIYHGVNADEVEGEFRAHEIESGMTALEVLQQLHHVEIEGEGEMAFVNGINDRIADPENNEFWAFYINDEPAEVGAGSYELQDGDHVIWSLETF